VKKGEITRRVSEVAALLGIDELLGRRPRELSGGQRQRVAIGRALVRRPQVFLMDEPLSNLDAKLRVQMRAELISLHHRVGITTIYVTHDQTEAMTLGDRVVVMNKGVVQQVDAPEELYRHPRNIFVASFIGSPSMNFVTGTVENGHIRVGEHSVERPDGLRRSSASHVVVGLRPEDFELGGDGAESIRAKVEIVERLGPEVLVHLRAEGLGTHYTVDENEETELGGTIVARFDPGFAARPGDVVPLRLSSARLQVFDPETGESLLAA
jgi:multiple sugar transport system ATP-binding protein